jgi:hypothetical protein
MAWARHRRQRHSFVDLKQFAKTVEDRKKIVALIKKQSEASRGAQAKRRRAARRCPPTVTTARPGVRSITSVVIGGPALQRL